MDADSAVYLLTALLEAPQRLEEYQDRVELSLGRGEVREVSPEEFVSMFI